MIRGTTPTHIFTVDVDLSTAVAIYITYEQNGRNLVEKDISDITVAEDAETHEKTLTTTLTQGETLRFRSGDVRIQIRAKFANGSAPASEMIYTTAEEILKDEVI
jgi:hypothetical protein